MVGEESVQRRYDALWRVSDVAVYLGIPVSSIYKMTAPKASLRIPHVRIAGKLRFRRTDIDEWLNVLTVSNIKVLLKANLRAS